MFGYVKAYKPELKMSEYETYKAIYCTLCRTLGKKYGIFAKMILSYDFTFLAMLRLATQQQCHGFSKMRCSFNPMVKCNRLKEESEEINYTAACAVTMFYYKIIDNINDSNFFSKLKYLLILPTFSFYKRKAAKRYPHVESAVKEMMQFQKEIELENCSSLDKAAEPTAKLLTNLFSRENDDETQKRILMQMGYCAGKWIYLIDALDDLDKDLKSGNYNPILIKYNITKSNNQNKLLARDNVKQLINVCDTELAASFELLKVNRFKTIIQNVIYLGMPNVLNSVVNCETKCKNTDQI